MQSVDRMNRQNDKLLVVFVTDRQNQSFANKEMKGFILNCPYNRIIYNTLEAIIFVIVVQDAYLAGHLDYHFEVTIYEYN